MTTNSLKAQELAETKRANLAQEGFKSDLTKADVNLKKEQAKSEKSKRFSNYAKGVGYAGKAIPVGLLNHPEWYNKLKQLAEAAAAVSTGTQNGLPIEFNTFPLLPDNSRERENLSSSTVMNLYFSPTFGGQLESSRVSNDVFAALYSYIYANINRVNNYDPSDIGKYLICIDSILTLIAMLQKAYGAAKFYDKFNLSLPKYLIEACNIDFESVTNGLLDLSGQINTLILQLSPLNVPANIDYFQRHTYLASSVFKDTAGNKSQYYQFIPSGYYTWDAATASVKWTYINSVMTVSQYFNIIQGMITALKTDSDILKISGDISKAFNEGDIISVSPMPIDYSLNIVVDDRILNQISNATILNINTTDTYASAMNITESNGSLVYPRQLPINITTGNMSAMWSTLLPSSKPATLQFFKPVVDFYMDKPSTDDVLMATRLVSAYQINPGSGSNSAGYEVVLYSCGSEIITQANVMYSIATAQGFAVESEPYLGVVPLPLFSTSAAIGIYQQVIRGNSLASQFDWKPIQFLAYENDDQSAAGVYINAELDNYAVVDSNILSNIHRASLYSLLLNPQSAKWFNK